MDEILSLMIDFAKSNLSFRYCFIALLLLFIRIIFWVRNNLKKVDNIFLKILIILSVLFLYLILFACVFLVSFYLSLF